MRTKTRPHVNLSREYQIVCAGEVAASFKTKEAAVNALRVSFSKRTGAFIAYPIGALNRDHLVAKKRKEAAKDSPEDTLAIHDYRRRVENASRMNKLAPAREPVQSMSFILPRMRIEVKDGDA